MNAQNFIQLLVNPENATPKQTEELADIIQEFPYFQAAYALHLKGLKDQGSFTYNRSLKQTAVRTTDRTVLFDYITSERFLQNEVSEQIKTLESRLHEISINDEIDVSSLLEEEEQEKARKILDPDLFAKKEDSLMTPKSAEEVLSLGKPLTFDKTEAHSFSEWLKLTTFKPIDRSKKENLEIKNDPTSQEETSLTTETEGTSQIVKKITESRKRKQQIIDSFIETNPKIKITPVSKTENKAPLKASYIPSESLMTETLARVYVEQKNYKKAKQAFRILSLKYPEKSGFFADQIRAVEQLEEQKD